MNKNKLSKIFSFQRSSFNIIDYDILKTPSFKNKILDKLKTKFVLNKMVSIFPGFKKSKIIKQTENLYISFSKSLKNKDSIKMMEIASFPLYNFIDESLKKEFLLNFDKNPIIQRTDLISARSYSNKINEANSFNTWYQISFKIDILENDVKKERVVVIEKRECDSKEKDWRICLVE